MKTSDVIKSKQYQPIEPTSVLDNGWKMVFESETRSRVTYTTVRDRQNNRNFKCGCPATGLCKHITVMVLRHAARFERVSVWTNEDDAYRQRRRMLEFTANGVPFWVTYGQEIITQEQDKVNRIVEAKNRINGLNSRLAAGDTSVGGAIADLRDWLYENR